MSIKNESIILIFLILTVLWILLIITFQKSEKISNRIKNRTLVIGLIFFILNIVAIPYLLMR